MNKLSAYCFVLICSLIGLVGCGPSHQRVPVLETGRVLHLAVKVPKDSTADAVGTAYYSMSSSDGSYLSTPLELRGRNLVTTLQTQSLSPGQRVAYYFDVFAGGEATSLGSPQHPYITDIVDRTELIQRSIESNVTYGKAGQTITFKLDPAGFSVGRATLSYTVPGLPGIVTQTMAPSGRVWTAEVPGQRVAPGLWNWRIDAEIEGIDYTHPAADGAFVSFTVKN